MNKQNNILIKTFLMGLLPLLGGTEAVMTAVFLALICIIISLITRTVYLSGKKYLSAKSLWLFLIVIGLSLTNIFYELLPKVLPFTAEYVNFYFLLAGVTPIVFAGCRKIGNFRFMQLELNFLLIMFVTSTLREFLGQGTFLGWQLIETKLLPFITGSIGAFIILGSLGITLELGIIKTNILSSNSEEKKGGTVSE